LVGQDLNQGFAREVCGTKINEKPSHVFQAAFPGVEGFSLRNLRNMRALIEAWPEPEITQQLVAKLLGAAISGC
jgi:hypothetical protein